MIDHIAHLLRIASTAACGIVLLAFAAWATDETKYASDQQAAQVASPGGVVTPVAVPAEIDHDGMRGAIEDANDVLVAPFDDVVQSNNVWTQHGVPALLALLAYGVLGRLLIGYLPR